MDLSLNSSLHLESSSKVDSRKSTALLVVQVTRDSERSNVARVVSSNSLPNDNAGVSISDSGNSVSPTDPDYPIIDLNPNLLSKHSSVEESSPVTRESIGNNEIEQTTSLMP